jgi:hypothetical protein
MITSLPLYALSLIFPYGSDIGTLANVVEGPGGADAGTEGIQKSAKGAIAFLLADIARRGHRHPQKPPQPSLWEDKSTVLSATQRTTTARKRSIQEGGTPLQGSL